MWFWRYPHGQTDTQTDILITILRNRFRGQSNQKITATQTYINPHNRDSHNWSPTTTSARDISGVVDQLWSRILSPDAPFSCSSHHPSVAVLTSDTVNNHTHAHARMQCTRPGH